MTRQRPDGDTHPWTPRRRRMDEKMLALPWVREVLQESTPCQGIPINHRRRQCLRWASYQYEALRPENSGAFCIHHAITAVEREAARYDTWKRYVDRES